MTRHAETPTVIAKAGSYSAFRRRWLDLMALPRGQIVPALAEWAQEIQMGPETIRTAAKRFGLPTSMGHRKAGKPS